MSDGILHALVPGDGTLIDSAFCFKHYFVDTTGFIEIGDSCCLANASLVSSSRITIGSCVMISGGVTIADSERSTMDEAIAQAGA